MTQDLAPRAARIILGINYLSLATCDADGPWVAPVHHQVLRGGGLSFVSDPSSRHGRAIAADPRVAATVFDTRLTGAEADGVQFDGTAAPVPHAPDALRAVLARRVRPDQDEQAALDRLLASADKRLYVVRPRHVYLFDRTVWRTSGADSRVALPLADVVAALDAGLIAPAG